MMTSLDDYFKALRTSGNSNTLAFVQTLIKSHITELPFTSIPVLLNENHSLELPDIIQRLVIYRRGGYCFEHNKLMYEALKSLGFSVTAHLARVILNRDTIPPKTHRVTILGYEGMRYLIDVGNSYLSPSQPINLDGREVETQHRRIFKIIETDPNTFQLQLIKDEGVYIIHQFSLDRCYEVDFELSHFYSHQHPKANFVNNLVLSKILSTEIRSLRNNNYQKIYTDQTVQTDINSLEEFTNILQNEFEYPITPNNTKQLFKKFVQPLREPLNT